MSGGKIRWAGEVEIEAEKLSPKLKWKIRRIIAPRMNETITRITVVEKWWKIYGKNGDRIKPPRKVKKQNGTLRIVGKLNNCIFSKLILDTR